MGSVRSFEKEREEEVFASITLRQLLECSCYPIVSNTSFAQSILYCCSNFPALWSLLCVTVRIGVCTCGNSVSESTRKQCLSNDVPDPEKSQFLTPHPFSA